MVKAWIIVGGIIVVLMIGGLLLSLRAEQYATSVPIKQVYRDAFGRVTKLVYDATGSEDLSVYRADCARQGGTFNECGTICEPGALVCVEVCAVTCTI